MLLYIKVVKKEVKVIIFKDEIIKEVRDNEFVRFENQK